MDGLVIFVWVFQIGVTLLVACIISIIMMFVLKRSRRQATSKNFLYSTILCFLMLSLGIFYIANNPIIRCPNKFKTSFTENMKNDIISYNKGFYSDKFPFFPGYIDVLSINGNSVVVQTNYFYFVGNTQMEIFDGMPSNIKPLFGL